jgi:hypothetical protein
MERCAICHDVFDDPVMCADGYCFCRGCIGTWVDSRRTWTSPLTNQTHTGPALMVPDCLRAGASREFHRAAVAALPLWERFLRTAYARFGASPLCAPDRECIALLANEAVLARVRAERPAWCGALLELCWRCCQIEAYPQDLVEPLCELEQTGRDPFIQREVWRQVLHALTVAYSASGEPETERALLACRAHFKWRLERTDGVFAPLSRTELEADEIFLREPLELEGSVTWRSKCGATLRIPSVKPSWVCESEDHRVELSAPGALGAVVFRSRVEVKLRGAAVWRLRRGPTLPFPDETGSSTSEAEEEPDPPTMFLGTLSVYEQTLPTLPEGFRYVPCPGGEHQATDATGTLDIANDLLVTGLQKRRRLT